MAAKRASSKPKSNRVFGQARKQPKMFRAGLYARVSTNDQQTIPLQIRMRSLRGSCAPANSRTRSVRRSNPAQRSRLAFGTLTVTARSTLFLSTLCPGAGIGLSLLSRKAALVRSPSQRDRDKTDLSDDIASSVSCASTFGERWGAVADRFCYRGTGRRTYREALIKDCRFCKDLSHAL